MWLSAVNLLTDFNSFYSERLEEAAFRDSYLFESTQAQFFLYVLSNSNLVDHEIL